MDDTMDVERLLSVAVASLDRAAEMWRVIVDRGEPAQIEATDAEEMAAYFDAMRLNLAEVARIVGARGALVVEFLDAARRCFTAQASTMTLAAATGGMTAATCRTQAIELMGAARFFTDALTGGRTEPAIKLATVDGEAVS